MRLLMLVVYGLIGAVLLAADEPKPSEPPAQSTAQKGQAIPKSFRALTVNGNRAGKFHDLINRQFLHPFVAVFARDAAVTLEKPLGQFLKKLDESCATRKLDKLGGFAVFLGTKDDVTRDDGRAELLMQLDAFVRQAKLEHVILGLDRIKSDQSDAFALAETDDIVILFGCRLKVRERFVFTKDKPMSEEDVGKLINGLDALIKSGAWKD